MVFGHFSSEVLYRGREGKSGKHTIAKNPKSPQTTRPDPERGKRLFFVGKSTNKGRTHSG